MVTGTLSDIAQLRLALVYMHPPADAIVRAPAGDLQAKPSLPGLTRQSIHLGKTFAKKMDARGVSAFTRVHSPSKTGINALNDALLPAHDVSSGARANAVAHPTIVAD